MRQRAQATLEFSLIFIISVILLAGLIGFWKWSSNNIIKRQHFYNRDRTSPLIGGQIPKEDSSIGSNLPDTLDNAEARKKFLDEAGDFSVLSLDQINSNLDSVNQNILDIQKNMPFFIKYRDMWQNSLAETQREERTSHTEVDRLTGLWNSAPEGDEKERSKIELDKAAYGYYTRVSDNRNEFGIGTYATTYEYTNDAGHYTAAETITTDIDRNTIITPLVRTESPGKLPWEGVLKTKEDGTQVPWIREDWAKDHFILRQYGVSEGNNVYGLYTDYTPGLADWAARKDYAKEQNDKAQLNVDRANNALSGLLALQTNLQAAKDSKTNP